MKIEISVFIKLVLTLIACALFFLVFTPVFANDNKKESLTSVETGQIKEDQRLLLKDISKKAMLPIFKELKDVSQTLQGKSQAFCDVKTKDSLTDLRHAWVEASVIWQQADSLLFGPTVDDNIDFAVYFLPIKKGIIKELLGADTILKQDVDAAGVGAQGFGTLEYLLFSRESSLEEIQNDFASDQRRCNYLLEATELLNENIMTISNQWEHYGEQFGLAGENSLYFFESSEAMTLLVNKIYQTAQKVSYKKVSLLNNKEEIKNSTPYKLQAWRSGTTLIQIKSNIRGIKRLITDGGILAWMKNHDKAKQAEEISYVIELILDQEVTDNDLFTVLKSSPKSLQDLVKNTQKLTELVKTELAPSLSVELGFNDNDGD